MLYNPAPRPERAASKQAGRHRTLAQMNAQRFNIGQAAARSGDRRHPLHVRAAHHWTDRARSLRSLALAICRLQHTRGAMWAPLMGGLGYLFGDVLGLLKIDLKQFEGVVLALIIAVAVAVAISFIRRWRSHEPGGELGPWIILHVRESRLSHDFVEPCGRACPWSPNTFQPISASAPTLIALSAR